MNYWEALLNWMIQLNMMTMRTYTSMVEYNEFIKRKEFEDERREIDNMLRECFEHVVINME